MTNRSIILALLLACAIATRTLAAQHPATPPYKRDVPGKLLPQAKISEDSARALARVPGSTVKALELEREHRHLIWSFDLTVAGKPGIEEVNVDALTGKVVSVVHEKN
jgi:uncharacterized membrane protein YkoI